MAVSKFKIKRIAVKSKLKKGDPVIVIAGKDLGKIGDVQAVYPKENKAIVVGINMVARHTKPSAKSAGGLVRKEMPIDLSNIAYRASNGKASKLGFKIDENGLKSRFVKATGELLNN